MNHKNITIFPSVMCCKPWDLLDYLRAFEQAGITAIHFDVMDGHFVPNIMLGASEFAAVRGQTDLPIDVHLMCVEPERFVPYFDLKAGDWLSFHPEACRQPYRLLESLRSRGIKAGFAFNPGTPIQHIEECAKVLDFVLVMAVNPGFAGQVMVPDHLDKLARIRDMIADCNPDIEIIIDGNTTPENAKRMYDAGATGFVTGTSSMLGQGAEKFPTLYREYIEALQS